MRPVRTLSASVLICLATAAGYANEVLPVSSTTAEYLSADAVPTSAHAPADRVLRALDLIGTPYRKRGTSPETGFDCSGFVGHVFRVADGITLPRTAQEMYRAYETPVSITELAPGDLLFFRIGRAGRAVDHVAIAIGDHRFIHAPASGGVVRIESLAVPYWSRRLVGARRVPVSGPEPDIPPVLNEVVSPPADNPEVVSP